MDDNELYGKVDLSSFSRTSEAVSTNIKLVWLIDFASQTVSGTCEHIVKILKAGVSEIRFDSSKLHIIGDVLVGYKVQKKAKSIIYASIYSFTKTCNLGRIILFVR